LTGAEALQSQCAEQHSRCLYTSVSLLIWLRCLRKIRIAFVVVPIIFGAVAGWDLLQGQAGTVKTVTATLALLAGLVPAVYAALKLDEHLPMAARLAGEYKNLEILFSDLRQVGPTKTFEEFEAEYKLARDRLEKANAEAYTAPEWCFRKAQKKIEAGHYSFEHPK
jgi:hypothetical protein